MSQTQGQSVPTQPNLLPTTEVTKGQLSVALMNAEAGLNHIAAAEAQLVFNEDNIEKIGQFLEKVKGARKLLNTKVSEIKAPITKAGRDVDAAKKVFDDPLEATYTRVHKRYTAIVQEMNTRIRLEKENRERLENIRKGINANVIEFSTKIAQTQNLKQLIEVERRINLEKSYKDKYQELLTEAVERYSELSSRVAEQKELLRKANKLDGEEKQQVQQQIQEHKINTQEKAIETVTSSFSDVTVIPAVAVKAKRTMYKWEVKNMDELKKNPALVVVVPNEEVLDRMTKEMQTAIKESKNHEIIQNGVRFYAEFLY